MKKQIVVLMLLSAVLLSGCGSDKSGIVTQGVGESPSKQVTTQPEQETNAKLIEASENKEVKLYAVNETDGEVQGVTVDVNGKRKEFDWKIADTGTKPQVFYTNLTGDGKEEAVILIQTGRGTELDTYDIHVLHAEDLTEIKVQSYEDIVTDQIESHVAKSDDGTLAITVKTQGKESKFDYGFDSDPDYNQDELAFGGVVIYSLKNQKIKLSLPGSVGVSPTYVCEFNITYKFDSAKNEFVADQIEVKPIEK
ncbi:hypothetical protein J2T13_001393 [Paenibacillus sp. DS2015]|uniref:hypothetical protein n=1 Tax=Paenibacillus sp. DS2015 TaxID=3373917 RepID=UPI003D209428